MQTEQGLRMVSLKRCLVKLSLIATEMSEALILHRPRSNRRTQLYGNIWKRQRCECAYISHSPQTLCSLMLPLTNAANFCSAASLVPSVLPLVLDSHRSRSTRAATGQSL